MGLSPVHDLATLFSLVRIGAMELRFAIDCAVNPRTRRESGAETLVPADTVILAGGVEPDTSLFDALRERIPEVHAVGDCTGLGLNQKATLEGARAACAL